MKDNVDRKIDLWKEVNNYANKVEETYPLFFSLFVAVLGAVLTILGTDIIPKDSLFARIILLIFVPIVMSAIMAYLAYNFRWVAIARMYATKLEKEINSELKENIFAWNCDIVDKYMAHKNFANTKLLPLVNGLFFITTLTVLNIFMWDLTINVFWKICYTAIITILFICCLAPFITNDRIRTEDYKF